MSGPGNSRHRRRRVLGLLGVLALAYVTTLAVQGTLAARALLRARTTQVLVVQALRDADLPAARAATDRLAADTSTARRLLTGPQWFLPEAVPLVGDDLRAVRVVVRALDAVVADAVPVVDTAAALRGREGGLDLPALARLEPALSRAADHAAAAQRQIGAIRPAGLLRPLRAPVTAAQEGVRRLASLTATARDGLRVAGAVLGLPDASSTLLGVQNPAEARASGGIVGAWATLAASDGSLRITSTGVNDQLFAFRAASDLVPPDVLATYGQDVRHVANVTMTPDFPVAAPLLLSCYRGYAAATPRAVRLDAATNVVTVTPRGLALLIGVTGPVQIASPRLTVTAGDAAAFFENTIYSAIPDDGRRLAVVQQVLRSVFTATQAPRTDPLRLAGALGAAATGGDLLLWSPDPAVQAAAGRLGATGALGTPDASALHVGVISADAAKLDYYLRESVVLDRRRRLLTVVLANEAPEQVAPYVAVQAPEPGEARTGHDVVVQLHLPPTVGVRRYERAGAVATLATGTESGWTVLRAGARVARGTQVRLAFDLTGAVDQLDRVLTQPLPSAPAVTVK